MKTRLIEVLVTLHPTGRTTIHTSVWSVHPIKEYTVVEEKTGKEFLMGMRGATDLLQSLKQTLYRSPKGKDSSRFLFFM